MNKNATEIESIVFGVYSPEEIKAIAVCKVDNPKMSGQGSVYDPRMGILTETRDKCVTCDLLPKMCPGHFGYIELVEPIIHPLYKKMVIAFLKCFCQNCHRLIIHPDQIKLWGFENFKTETKFTKILENIESINICFHCSNSHPSVKHKKKEDEIHLEYKEISAQKTSYSIVLSVEDIKRIFDNILDEDLIVLGFNPTFVRPRNLIMTVFPVLPPCARPYIISEGNICDDDLTSHILYILKDNIKLEKNKETGDNKKRQKLLKSLIFHISTFYDNHKKKAKHPTDNQPIKGLKERLSSKEGQIRQNNMGKRVDFSGRTVIGPDPTLKMDEMAVPECIAKILTFPENVLSFNIDELTKLVNDNKANFIIRNNGETRINLKYGLFRHGTELLYGDIIVRDQNLKLKTDKDGKIIIPDMLNNNVIFVKTGMEKLKEGDRLIRNGKLLEDIQYPTKKNIKLRVGDIVERHLKDGDIVLLNRQPTLHKGSMIAKKVVVKPHMTFRMNLAVCASFNADFDGDEMNIHVPQSYETVAELKMIGSTKNMIVTPQESKPNITIVQDSLLAAYKMTKGFVNINKDEFYNITLKGERHNGLPLFSPERIQTIRQVMKRHGKKIRSYTGHGLISLILPYDFYYEYTNKANPKEPTIKISQGVMYEGTLSKTVLGSSHNSIIQVLYKEYGPDITSNFVDNIQFITNAWLSNVGFSVGLEDCMVASKESQITIKHVLTESYIKAQCVENMTQNPGIKEVRITAALSQAKDIGMRIAKEAMREDNNFLDTVNSGSKGDFFNIAQLTAMLGQQNLSGQRVKYTLNHGKRTLPHYPIDENMSKDREYESRGFVSHSFIHGLTPQEFFFHAMSGREGICDTAMSTADSGYIQRRIVKVFEDMQVRYDGTVRDSTNTVYQYSYDDNGLDPTQTVKVDGNAEICDISRIVNRLNQERKYSKKKTKKNKKTIKKNVVSSN